MSIFDKDRQKTKEQRLGCSLPKWKQESRWLTTPTTFKRTPQMREREVKRMKELDEIFAEKMRAKGRAEKWITQMITYKDRKPTG